MQEIGDPKCVSSCSAPRPSEHTSLSQFCDAPDMAGILPHPEPLSSKALRHLPRFTIENGVAWATLSLL